jgi:capsular exopolysaccharide synthesis family protein
MEPVDSNRPDSSANLPSAQPDATHGTPGHPHEMQPVSGTLVPVPTYHPGYATALVPTAPPGLSGVPDVFGLLRALKRRWLLALTAGLAAAALAVGATYVVLLWGKYTARTLLYVSAQQPVILFRQVGWETTRRDFGTYQRTQVVLIKSRLVLNAALRDPRVAELKVVQEQLDPVEWLEKLIQVEYLNGSEVMRISVTGDDMNQSLALVSGVTSAYLNEIVNKERIDRAQHLETLRTTLARYEEAMKNKRQTLRTLAEAVGSNNVENVALKQKLALDQLGRLQGELVAVTSQLRNTKIETQALEARDKAAGERTLPERAITDQIEADASVRRKQDKVIRLEESLQSLVNRYKYAPTDPIYKNMHQSLEQAQKDLEAIKQRLRPKFEEDFRERSKAYAAARAAAAQERLAFIENIQRLLKQEIQQTQDDIRTLTVRSVDLESLKAEILLVDGITKKIQSEIEAMTVELNAPARVRMLDQAVVVNNRDPIKQMRMAAIFGFGTFGLVLLGVAWREFRTRRLDSEEEVVRGLGMKLIGALPALPNRVRSRPAGLAGPQDHHWHQMMMESVDATRTMLLYAAKTEGLKVVLIPSAVGGEGKTSLSWHLSTSLARAGRRTLLVDCDLRRPTTHRLFEVELEPGVSEVLRGEATLDQVVRPTTQNGLSLITAGRVSHRTIEALAQEEIHNLLAAVREQYDFVVIDSSPVLAVTDTLLIAQHTDGVLFSLLREVSRMPAIYAAYQRLSAVGIRTLGAVVSGAKGERYNRAYRYSYYGYGSIPAEDAAPRDQATAEQS